MKILIKLFIAVLLAGATTGGTGYFFWYRPKPSLQPRGVVFALHKSNDKDYINLRLRQKAVEARDFTRLNHYNKVHCFFIDMKISSGGKRFFVYNLSKDSVEGAGLVAHGSGSDKGGGGLVFSNRPNSNCSSLGRYRIGKPYYGRFGLAYKLYGLEESNDKAFERFVVLHAHACVPNEEVLPVSICESWGCPTVAPAFLGVVKDYINSSAEPVLLWIYY